MILVTGATGLVGAHLLVDLTQNESKVRAIYRNKHSVEKTRSLFELYQKSSLFDKIEWVQADILDIPSLENAFAKVTHVYHCAAMISFNPDDEEKLRKTNIEGTANIVNFCLGHNVKKLCHVSSVAALGDLQEHESIITEKTEWNPEKEHSDYAISKYGAEMEIWRAQQEGLDVVVVNPGIILGPGFWQDGSGKLFSGVANGLKFFTKGKAGYISVLDVVKSMIELMNGNISGERYILVAESISFEEITKKIARELNVPGPSVYANKLMTEMAWRLDWMSSTFLKKERKLSKISAQTVHNHNFYSNQKIKESLGLKFISPLEYISQISDYYS